MQRRFGGLAGGATVAMAACMTGDLTEVALGMTAIAGMLVVGVVLPAVWSACPDRRRDARAVLRLILSALRQPR
jgi:hypothetical protein